MLCLTLHPPGVHQKYPDGTYLTFRITKPCAFDVKVLESSRDRVKVGITGDPETVQCVRSNIKDKEKYVNGQ